MLPLLLPLYRMRRKRHMAFALRSNSPDCEMTSLIGSRGFVAAAAAVAESMPDRQTGGWEGKAVSARKRRRSAGGCR